MPSVVTESALAYLNIVATRIGNVGRSVCRIPTVHSIELARITSAWIPASEFAVRTQNARLSITYPLVAASKITKVIRSSSVNACNVSLPSFCLLPEKALPLKKTTNFTTLHLDSTRQTLRALPLRTQQRLSWIRRASLLFLPTWLLRNPAKLQTRVSR